MRSFLNIDLGKAFAKLLMIILRLGMPWLLKPNHRHHNLKKDCFMSRSTSLVCLVSSVSGRYKNSLGKASASSGHITKLEQSTVLRYL